MSEEMKPEEQAKPESSPKRRLWPRIVGGILLILAILLVIAVSARDAIVRNAVIKIGTAVTGTKVEMDSFSSSFDGTVQVGGFRVANPRGYNAPYAIQVESIRGAVDLGSLFSNKIIIKEILVSGTEVNYELKLNGSSNLTDIKKNIDAFAESSAPKAGEPSEQTAKTEKTEEAPGARKQVMIRKLSISGSFLTISSSLLKTDVPLPLPPLEMTDLGEGKSFGETVDEFATKVLDTILTTASKSGLKGIGKSLKDGGKNLGDSVGSNLQEVEKALHDTVKGLFK